jgi:hypothetical protein
LAGAPASAYRSWRWVPVILVPAGVMALNPERDLTIESIQKTITMSVDQNPERKISVQNRYTMPILANALIDA